MQNGRNPIFWRGFLARPRRTASCRGARDARRAAGGEEAEAMMSALRLVLLFVVTLALMGALMGALTGCPGPNYAPYDNMNNNSPG
jgi:hypothetical protein